MNDLYHFDKSLTLYKSKDDRMFLHIMDEHLTTLTNCCQIEA